MRCLAGFRQLIGDVSLHNDCAFDEVITLTSHFRLKRCQHCSDTAGCHPVLLISAH